MEQGRSQTNEVAPRRGERRSVSLDVITSAVVNINDMSTQIAAAVEQQSTVAEEINCSITTIRDVAEVTMEGSQQSESASMTMDNLT